MQFLLAAADGTIWNALRLRFGHNQRKEHFKFRNSGKSADFPELPFHGRGRKGKRHLQRRFLRKRGAAGKAFAGFQRAEPSQALPRQLPRRGSLTPSVKT